MPSVTAQRIGSTLLSLEFATRQRSLAFSVVSVERNRQQITRPYTHHAQPAAFNAQPAPQPQQQSQPRLAPRSQFRAFSNEPRRFQQAQAAQSSNPPPAAAPSAARTAGSQQPSPAASRATSPAPQDLPITDISSAGLSDAPPPPYTPSDSQNSVAPPEEAIDWARSFHGLSLKPFSPEASSILTAPLDPKDIELKPDGLIYLPEIKYRRILNRAFGPGGWGLAPRSETIVTAKMVTREYALLCHGRLVSVARGEQEYFDREGIPTATEGCKSNALMRCCKDLGVASELWDPRFIRKFMKDEGQQVWVEHVVNKRKRQIWKRKGDEVAYPYKETK